MTSKKSTLLLVVLLVLLLLVAAVAYNALSPAAAPAEEGEEAEEAEAAPDFSMQDAEGNTVSLSDFAGKPVVLNFWASWCGPCQQEMPVFDALAAELDGEVQFLMVNLTDGGRETVEVAAQFIADRGYTFPVYYDSLGEGALAYAVRSIPVTYFIDGEGNVQAYHAGSLSEDGLRQGLAFITG